MNIDRERKFLEALANESGIILRGSPVNPTVAVDAQVNVWDIGDERNWFGSLGLEQIRTYRINTINDYNDGEEPMVLLTDEGGNSMRVPLEDLMRTGTYGGERFQVVQEYST